MRTTVQEHFRAFNEPIEGSISYMYADVKQLVTVGVGNLIDPVELATELPFRWKNKPGVATPGALANGDDITGEWHRIKNDPQLAKAGHTACAPITNLELDNDAINDLIQKRLSDNESFLKRHSQFNNFEDWPADAQLAVLSMAWAMGAAGVLGFPKFCAACAATDFRNAAAECQMSEAGNPGVAPRNRANRTLLLNAATVVEGESAGLQREILYYPKALTQVAAAG